MNAAIPPAWAARMLRAGWGDIDDVIGLEHGVGLRYPDWASFRDTHPGLEAWLVSQAEWRTHFGDEVEDVMDASTGQEPHPEQPVAGETFETWISRVIAEDSLWYTAADTCYSDGAGNTLQCFSFAGDECLSVAVLRVNEIEHIVAFLEV